MDQYGVKFQAFLCCINCLPWHLQISTTLQESFDRLNTLLGYCVKDPQWLASDRKMKAVSQQINKFMLHWPIQKGHHLHWPRDPGIAPTLPMSLVTQFLHSCPGGLDLHPCAWGTSRCWNVPRHKAWMGRACLTGPLTKNREKNTLTWRAA